MATPNGTQFQVATDAAFSSKLIDYSGSYKTSHATTSGVLTKGVPLYARVRHSSVETGYSAWGATRQFSIANYYQSILYISSTLPTNDNMFEFEHRAFNGNYSILVGSYMLVKLAPDNKTIVWKKTTASTNHYFGSGICTDENDNVYFLTMIYVGTDVYKSSLIKLDSNGNKVWERIFPNNAGGYTFDLKYRNGYIYFSANIHRRNIVFGKISVNGDTSFLKYYTHWNDIWICNLFLDSSDNIIVAGTIKPWSNCDTTVTTVIKYTNSGTVIWGKSYSVNWSCGQPGFLYMRSVMDDQNNLYVYGYDQNSVPMLFKINTTDGSFIWKKNLGNMYLHDLVIASDGSMIGYGYAYRLVKFASDGTVLWERTATITNGQYLLYSRMVQYPTGELRLNMVSWLNSSQYQNFFHCVLPNAYGLSGSIPSLSSITWATTTQTSVSDNNTVGKYDYFENMATNWGSMAIPTVNDYTFAIYDAPALTFATVTY